jgi:hypothetical protein
VHLNVAIMPEAPTIVLGSAGPQLRLRALRRLYPQCTDYWDGNWLACEAQVGAGAFSGSFEAELRTDELARFAEQLAVLYGDLKGEAVLASTDFWIDVIVKGDGRGHFVAEAWLKDQAGVGNQLTFQLRFDQTELTSILSALRRTLELFPVFSHPDD